MKKGKRKSYDLFSCTLNTDATGGRIVLALVVRCRLASELRMIGLKPWVKSASLELQTSYNMNMSTGEEE